MISEIILLPEALADAREAYEWDEGRSPGLGERFLTCVDECLDYIRRDPQMFEVVHEGFRRAIVGKFPYVIFYEHERDVVTVYSVFYSAQYPEKWRQRLSK
jgi:plasmid stabilization system protein ParE